jgi:hypothetical protein
MAIYSLVSPTDADFAINASLRYSMQQKKTNYHHSVVHLYIDIFWMQVFYFGYPRESPNPNLYSLSIA